MMEWRVFWADCSIKFSFWWLIECHYSQDLVQGHAPSTMKSSLDMTLFDKAGNMTLATFCKWLDSKSLSSSAIHGYGMGV